MPVRIKAILSWICAAAMLIFCYSTNGILPGNTTYLELREKLPDSGEYWIIGSYNFIFRNRAGNFVVAEAEASDSGVRVSRVQCYDAGAVNPSHARFSMIREGMTVFQVTALVGIPVAIEPAGFETYRYAANDGTQYQIVWTKKDGMSVVDRGAEKIENSLETVKTNRVLPWAMNHLCSLFLLAAIAVTWDVVLNRKAGKLQKQEG